MYMQHKINFIDQSWYCNTSNFQYMAVLLCQLHYSYLYTLTSMTHDDLQHSVFRLVGCKM